MKWHAAMPGTRGFWGVHIEIDHNRVLSVPHDHCFADLIWAGIDFLMRHVRWNVNKVARPSLNHHCAGPSLACSNCRPGNCGSARHARRLCCIQVKFIRMYDFDSMFCPIHW